MSNEKKKGSKPVSPTEVAQRLQTSITTVTTLPKDRYKMVEAKKRKRRFATNTKKSK